MTTAYPLAWPSGWPRTIAHQRKESSRQFLMKRSDPMVTRRAISFDDARRSLLDELRQLGAKDIVLSTNVPLRNDGAPRATEANRRYDDPGVAVYFMYKKRPMVMASDRYDAPSANIRSLALAVGAMRQLERHGGGTMMERAFSGFAQLPPPLTPSARKPWREVFGIKPGSIIGGASLTARYHELVKLHHPDRGGSDLKMSEINVAYADAKRELGYA